jgi:cysteinyl-tRNA synthetase
MLTQKNLILFKGQKMKHSTFVSNFWTLSAIRDAYTGAGLRHALHWAGYKTPARLSSMYLRGEPAEYILAACIACDTVGA